MESLLGFGIYNAVASGVLAAQAIYERTSYEQKLYFLIKGYIIFILSGRG